MGSPPRLLILHPVLFPPPVEGKGPISGHLLLNPHSIDLGNRGSQRGTQASGVRADLESTLWKESREPEPHVSHESQDSEGKHPLPDL